MRFSVHTGLRLLIFPNSDIVGQQKNLPVARFDTSRRQARLILSYVSIHFRLGRATSGQPPRAPGIAPNTTRSSAEGEHSAADMARPTADKAKPVAGTAKAAAGTAKLAADTG